MKKNMIALAVAAAMVAPVAMADVTVSGGLQAELVQVGGDGFVNPKGTYANDAMTVAGLNTLVGNKNGLNSGNYGFLKFAASEDLGGGLKALASYNMNVAVDNVGPGVRDAFVGLTGGFGTILAGRLASPYKSSTVSWDPFLATSFQARDNFGMSFLQDGYANNAIAYANSFGGNMVNLVAAVVLDETAKTTDPVKTNGKHAKSVSVDIKPMSGLDLVVAWIDVSEFGDASQLGVVSSSVYNGPLGKDASATKVGVKYAAGAFSIAGQVEMINKGLSLSTGEKGNIMYLTAGYKMDDANSIDASYGQVDKKLVDGVDGANYAAVGFTHAFSKNTRAMVGYRASKDKSAGGLGKDNAFGAGLRVSF